MQQAFKATRRDADDDDGNAIDECVLVEDGGVAAEVLLEKAVAQDDGPLGLKAIVVPGFKKAPERGRELHHGEEVVGDQLIIDAD